MNAKLEARCTIGFVYFVELYLFCGNISDLYHTHFQSTDLFNATFSNILPLFGGAGLSSPKKITQWQELAGQQHGQGLAHARG